MIERTLDLLVQTPELLYVLLGLSAYGSINLLWHIGRFSQKYLKNSGKNQINLQQHYDFIRTLTSDLYLQCHRMVDGDYAEASFLYHVWQFNGGPKNEMRDYEIKKLIEAAQDSLKMMHSSYNNLTISNIKLREASIKKLTERWEILFLWIRGHNKEVLRLSQDNLEQLLSFQDIPSTGTVVHTVPDQVLKTNNFLDIQLRVHKNYNSYDKGLLEQILEIKTMVEKQIENNKGY